MTYNPYDINLGVPPPPPRLSKTSLTGFIISFFFCVPLASVVALVFSIVGLFVTGSNKLSGRGFAVAGVILSVLGIGVWVGATMFFVNAYHATAVPRAMAATYTREVAAGNYAAALAMCDPSVKQADLEAQNKFLTGLGSVKNITAFGFSFSTGGRTVAVISGAVEMSKDVIQFEVAYEKDASGNWKIQKSAFHH